MIFKATPDKSVKVVTVITSLIFLLSSITLVRLYIYERIIILPVLALFLVVAFFFVYALRPVSYTLTNDQLIINRMAGKVLIPRSSIKSFKVIHRNLIDGSIRTFGVSGLFGYYGKFSNRKLGSMTWYVRRMDQLVLINTNADKILVSPDDIDGFIAALH